MAAGELNGDLIELTRRQMLPKMPRAGWEGWFSILIARKGSPVRWTKTHLYRSRKIPFFHSMGATEGMTSAGEMLTLVGLKDRVHKDFSEFSTYGVRAGDRNYSLALDGLQWNGECPSFQFDRHTADGKMKVRLDLKARDRIEWVGLPGVITYFGLHSEAKGFIVANGERHEVRGLAVQEHAWGGLVPFDPLLVVRGRWQWDVLSFEEAQGIGKIEEPTALAGIWLPVPGRRSFGMRAEGRLPGTGYHKFRGYKVEYLETEKIECGHKGKPGIYPKRWLGTLSDSRGNLSYEAVASTPPAAVAPGGGFIGFDFEATYRPKSGAARKMSGSGFGEFGGVVK